MCATLLLLKIIVTCLCLFLYFVYVFMCVGELGVVYRGNLKDWWTKGQLDLVAVKTLKGLHVLCN